MRLMSFHARWTHWLSTDVAQSTVYVCDMFGEKVCVGETGATVEASVE